MMLNQLHYQSRINVRFLKEINSILLEVAATIFHRGGTISNGDLRKIKTNTRSEVYQFAFQNEVYYLKRFYSASLADQIKNLFRQPKAVTNYLMSLKLTALGFGIAEPVAALVYQRNIFKKESLFITKSYDGMTLLEYINSSPASREKEKTVAQFMEVLGRFYHQGFVHGDPNLTNFLVREQNGKPNFAFIDLDSVKQLPLPIHLYTFKSLARLYSFALLTMSESNNLLVRSQEKMAFFLNAFMQFYNRKIKISQAQHWIQKNVKYW